MSEAKLQLTKAGIPNTCSECAEMQHVAWYAKHDDQARAGGGRCAKCAGIEPETKKKPTRRRATTSSRKKTTKETAET